MKKEVFDSIDSKLLKNFEIIKKVGQGAFGQVWKVKNKKTGNICALKKIYQAFKSPGSSQRTYREIKYLQKLQHPSIVKLHNWYGSSSETEIYLELQFMEADLCLALRNGVLKPIHKHYIFYQLANALKYLHSAELIHRDIKPTNILVNETCEAKLCDFGLIRSVARDSTKETLIMTEKVATRWYRAPEILLGSKNYGKAVDIWSIGCVLAQMILQKPIFQGSSAIDQMQKVFEVVGLPTEEDLESIANQATLKILKSFRVKQRKNLKNILNSEDANLLDLLDKIFQVNPMKRPTADQILSHPFVSKFRGRIEEKGTTLPIKILYQSKLLSSDDYKNILFGELEESHSNLKMKHKNSHDSSNAEEAADNKMIFKTMPQMTRNAFMNVLPVEKKDKSPTHVNYFNQHGFSPFGTKKSVSPIKERVKDDHSTNQPRSPSFLAKKKQNNLTPDKNATVPPEKQTILKRTLTFPLRISPSKSANKKKDQKSVEKVNVQALEGYNPQKKKTNEQSRVSEDAPKIKFPTSPQISNQKFDIFSSTGLTQVHRKLEKKPSLTFIGQASISGFPISTTPPKAIVKYLSTILTPVKKDLPELSTKPQELKLPAKQGLTFKAPHKRSSPTGTTLKVLFPSTPPTQVQGKKGQ